MISIYVRNKNLCPASYYRIAQYTNYMNDIDKVKYNNIASDRMFYINQQVNRKAIYYQIWRVAYFIHMTLRGLAFEVGDLFTKPETVIISRSIFPHRSMYLERMMLKVIVKRAQRVIWDFDDDIFLNGEISVGERAILEKYATKIVVTHEYLKELINKENQNKVVTMPTTDGDFDRYIYLNFDESRVVSLKDKINLVWVGQAVNLKYFNGIVEELDECARYIHTTTGQKVELTIVCNKPLETKTQILKINNRQWSKEVALSEMCKAHIGIMPLNNEKYVLGKGGFKLIQYMSASLPVIGSNTGYNKEIIDESFGMLVNRGEWGKAVIELTKSKKEWVEKSHNARKKWENSYSFNVQEKKWEKFVKEDNGIR